MKPRKQKTPDFISAQLYDEEELLWWGQPIASRLALQVNVMSIVMSAAMAIFAVGFFVISRDMMSDMPGSFGRSSNGSGIRSFVSIMFIIVPGMMFLGAGWQAIEPLRKYVMGLRTYYMLTNKRAIIINNLLSTQIRSFYDENVNKIEVHHFGNDSGSVIFSTEQMTRQVRRGNRNGFNVTFGDDGVNFSAGQRTRNVNYTVQHGFMAIHDVRTVEDLVSQVFFEGDEKKK